MRTNPAAWIRASKGRRPAPGAGRRRGAGQPERETCESIECTLRTRKQGDHMALRLLVLLLAVAIGGCSSFWSRKPAAAKAQPAPAPQPAASTAAMPAQ